MIPSFHRYLETKIWVPGMLIAFSPSQWTELEYMYQEWFVQHRCNLAAKESGLECTCLNNDDFTVLVSGGGRRH